MTIVITFAEAEYYHAARSALRLEADLASNSANQWARLASMRKTADAQERAADFAARATYLRAALLAFDNVPEAAIPD